MRKPINIVKKGWVARTAKESDIITQDKYGYSVGMAPSKGEKEEWHPYDWPPIRIEVVIREVKK